ncbi:MAG: hypothetical protein AABZ01_13620 [Gemmatimonadota bacterium]
MIRSLLALSLVGMVIAAASPAEAQKPKRNPDVITAEEIAARTDIQTAYDAVRRLRGGMLRTRPGGSVLRGSDPIWVYVDNIKAGDLDALENILASRVYEIRKFSASDATTRFGTGHTNGVILVTTIRNQQPPEPNAGSTILGGE